MKRIVIIAACLFTVSLVSCRRTPETVLKPSEYYCSTWLEVFDAFWDGMNYSYVFWDIDPTDWDEVYDRYRPEFEQLGDWSEETLDDAQRLFEEITANLIDHHYALTLYHPDTGETAVEIHPGLTQIKQRDYYHEIMSEEQLIQNVMAYKESGRITQLVGGTASAKTWLMIFSYLIDDVAYISINGFLISDLLEVADEDDNALRGFRNFFHLVEDTPNLKGVIIDVRGNSGGYLNDMHVLLEPLISEDCMFGYSRTKSGLGRLDYTPWQELWIYATDSQQYRIGSKPIVLLTDLYSISMAEFTALAVGSLPNGYIIGERTFGGQGMLYDYDEYYAGTFSNNALRVYMSSKMSKDVNGNTLEGIGVTPDMEVLFDAEQFNAGVDTQLEAALEYVNSVQ